MTATTDPTPTATTVPPVSVTVGHDEAKVIVFTSFVVNTVELHLTMREGATAEQAKALLLEMGIVTRWLKDTANASFNLSLSARDGLLAKSRRDSVKDIPTRDVDEDMQPPDEGDEDWLPDAEEDAPTPPAPLPPARAAAGRPERAASSPPTNGAAAPRTPARGNARGNAPAAPRTPAARPAAQAGPLTFPAKVLTGEIKSGKVYWKIAGGMFVKYGVRVWPEVLEAAGFDLELLDPNDVTPMDGLTAVYEVNEDGQPTKVTSLY